MKNTAEVIAVGNELLIGQTLDTNSNWIARQLNMSGWILQRVTVLRDSLRAIGTGIGEALGRNPRLLITVGGLGPTHDDMTLRGLSRAVHKPLVLNEKALGVIRKRYEGMDASTVMTRFRRKMALLPRGARSLPNPVGTAPGILIKIGGTTVVSLPGVPDEMKAIFKGSIAPILHRSGGSAPVEAYVSLIGIVESALAPLLEQAQRRFPNLYFKSHPKGRETGIRSLIQIHIYTIGKKHNGKLDEAIAFLVKGLAAYSRNHQDLFPSNDYS